MMSSVLNTSVSSFGKIAVRLAQNPLGIIALFIVLVYALAALVAGLGHFESDDRRILIWFLAVFPFVVLGSFLWLVARHSTKLYAPQDFADETTYLRLVELSSGTVKAVEATAESAQAVRSALKPILRPDTTDAQLAALQYITRWNTAPPATRNSLTWTWNLFEEMGIGISRNLIDEAIARDFFKGIVAREWQRAIPMLARLREQGAGEALYANFETLATRWAARPS